MMRSWLVGCLLGMAVVIGSWVGLGAGEPSGPHRLEQTRPPAYLILHVPSRAHKGWVYYQGRGYAVRTTPYAYGWFGARSHRHWYRSTGYYSDYIQWQQR